MFKLNLPSPKKNWKKKWSIHIDKDKSYEFKTKKEAQIFVKELTDKLNTVLVSASELLSKTYSCYRYLYFHIENVGQQEDLDRDFNHCHDQIGLIITRSKFYTSSNIYSLIYSKLVYCLTKQKEICSLLKYLADRTNQFSIANTLQNELRLIEAELKFLSLLDPEKICTHVLSLTQNDGAYRIVA